MQSIVLSSDQWAGRSRVCWGSQIAALSSVLAHPALKGTPRKEGHENSRWREFKAIHMARPWTENPGSASLKQARPPFSPLFPGAGWSHTSSSHAHQMGGFTPCSLAGLFDFSLAGHLTLLPSTQLPGTAWRALVPRVCPTVCVHRDIPCLIGPMAWSRPFSLCVARQLETGGRSCGSSA